MSDDVIERLLADIDASAPAQLPRVLARARVSASLRLHLVDYASTTLLHLPDLPEPPARPIPIDGTDAGRAFMEGRQIRTVSADRDTLWVPIRERGRSVGVLELTDGQLDDRALALATPLGNLIAHLIASGSRYSDTFVQARRTEPLTLAAEIQWDLLPPVTYEAHGVSVAGVLEPAYDVGGDSFDYSVGDDDVHFALFDAMGRGVSAALLVSVAIGALRWSRRKGDDLLTTADAIDACVMGHSETGAFVTGIIGQLDLRDGTLRIVNAGHEWPLVFPAEGTPRELELLANLPFGMLVNDRTRTFTEQRFTLSPGELLVATTDGMSGARDVSGTALARNTFLAVPSAVAALTGNRAYAVARAFLDLTMNHVRGDLKDDASALVIALPTNNGD